LHNGTQAASRAVTPLSRRLKVRGDHIGAGKRVASWGIQLESGDQTAGIAPAGLLRGDERDMRLAVIVGELLGLLVKSDSNTLPVRSRRPPQSARPLRFQAAASGLCKSRDMVAWKAQQAAAYAPPRNGFVPPMGKREAAQKKPRQTGCTTDPISPSVSAR